MFLNIKRNQQQEMIHTIENILPIGASVLSFNYKGNLLSEEIFVEIRCADKSHIFHTIKGNIYYNNRLYCNSSYHYLEKQSTFGKLLDVIKQITN